MEKKQLVMLGVLVLAGSVILVSLYAFSPLSKEVTRGGFNRVFVSPVLTEKGLMDIEFNSFYIAGNTKDKLYLGNLTAPFHLLITNLTLTDSQHVKLNVKLDSITELRRFKLSVDSPYFFLLHGGMPEILRGQIDVWEASESLSGSKSYFVDATPINKSSFALRSYSLEDEGFELGKKSEKIPFQFNSDLLQKQVDGSFCVEGQLHYSKPLKSLIYLYNYRNEFMMADTNLVLNYRAHTIDTFSHVKIKVAQLEKNKQMLSSPPMRVNGKSTVSGNYLYVQSNIVANNEYWDTFITSSVIDVYDLVTGSYKHSFYIPNYHNERFSDFRFIGNHLAVIYDHFLIMYEIDAETAPL